MHLIEGRNQIAEAQNAFQQTLLKSGAKEYKCKLGYQGGTNQADVFWLESVGIWVAFQKIENRYWNAFGVVEPENGENLNITCEINSPLKGINRRISGAFAMDNEGEMYILHSGRIGGGRTGIGKSLFKTNYKYGLIKLDDELEYAQIGKLWDATLPNNTANFVKEIDRIKKLAKGESDSFKSEFAITKVNYTHPTKDLIEKSLKEIGKMKASKDELLMKLKEIIGRDGGLLIEDEIAWQEINELNEE